MSKFGKELNRIITRLYTSEAELAKEVGVGQPHINRIKNNEKEPSRELIAKLQAAIHQRSPYAALRLVSAHLRDQRDAAGYNSTDLPIKPPE